MGSWFQGHETRPSGAGTAFSQRCSILKWEVTHKRTMPRIKDELLDSVIYLYPSEASARRGEKAGGSGFVAGIESAADPEGCWLYAVTNRHVVEDGRSRTIRLNTRDGELESWLVGRICG